MSNPGLDPHEEGPQHDRDLSPRPFFPSIMVPVVPFAVGAAGAFYSPHQSLVPLSPAAAAADPAGFYYGVEETFDTCGPGPPICTSSNSRGPKGSNLFVFHLPAEMTNWDFYLLFRKFGVLLSVSIMVQRDSGLSKGYGFLSYSSPGEAQAAIGNMDGFKLGKKRLKVQLKREDEEAVNQQIDNESPCSSPDIA